MPKKAQALVKKTNKSVVAKSPFKSLVQDLKENAIKNPRQLNEFLKEKNMSYQDFISKIKHAWDSGELEYKDMETLRKPDEKNTLFDDHWWYRNFGKSAVLKKVPPMHHEKFASVNKTKKEFKMKIALSNLFAHLDKDCTDKIKNIIESNKRTIPLSKFKAVLDNVTFAKLYDVMAAGLPREDYPPANIAGWIKECENNGLTNEAQQIKDQWKKVLDKYPQTRLNWATASVIGTNSIKKNVFEHKEFAVWFSTKVEVSSEEKKRIKILPQDPIVNAPAIAIPSKDETPEDWKQAEAKTQELVARAKEAFAKADELLAFLQKEQSELERKIKSYDVGGEKRLTKSGKITKLAERIPEWKAQLDVYAIEISKLQKTIADSNKDFNDAAKEYNKAPVTTVAYEKAVQKSIAINIEYLEKLTKEQNWAMVSKVSKELEELKKELEKEKVAASTQVTSGLLDIISGVFKKLVAFTKMITNWVKGFTQSVSDFSHAAKYLGR